jgi:hypothetical protein|nr:MAG TPA: hypothetical protein [Caudoviricetes sp.]
MNITIKRGSETLHGIVPLDLQWRLNEQLDGGTANYIKTEDKALGANTPLDKYIVTIDNETFEFVGMDSFAVWKRQRASRTDESGNVSFYTAEIRKHQLALTEPTKLLQGVMIDGFQVTQPNPPTKTLKDVVTRVLKYSPFDGQRFYLTTDTTIVSVLTATISPEFRWNTQTTLFEVLQDIGAVINAIPRLVSGANGEFTVVTYDFVDDYGTAVTDLADGFTTDTGNSVDGDQYNSELTAVVENLTEE